VTTDRLLPLPQGNIRSPRSVNWNSTTLQFGQRRAGNRGDAWNRKIGSRANRASSSNSPDCELGCSGSQRIVDATPLKPPASPRMNPGSIDPPHLGHTSLPEGSAIHSTVEIDVISHPRPLPRSEDTVPAGVRWRTKKAKAWSESLEGVSQGTRRTYTEKAILAFAALERLGFNVSPQDVSAPMVEALLHDETLAPTTRATYAFCLRGVLRFVKNPVAGPERKRLWKPPRWVATHRRWATLEESSAMLNAARDDAARVAIALLGCGLRQDEVLRLTVGALDRGADGWTALVRGKGGKPRQVPLTSQAIDALVPMVHGKPTDARVYPWGRTRLWRDVDEACRVANLRHLAPHDGRRGYARSYLRVAVASGMSYPDALGSLQAILGHEDAAQTLYYASPEREVAVRGVSAMSKAYTAAISRGA
jgi:integrase